MACFSFCPSGAAMRAALLSVVIAAGMALSAPTSAVGRLADITVIDRDSGQVLPVHSYQGRHYVAGRPGARYAVRVYNRSNVRVMAVVAVDGVNVVSGDTASWEQNGYVFSSSQRHDIAGWRKSQSEIAAFEFTALPNSYAARTGRPENVGVIGVALFRELTPAPLPLPPPAVTPPARPFGGGRSREDVAGGVRAEAGPGGSGAADAPAHSTRKSAAEHGSGDSANSNHFGNARDAAAAATSAAESRALSRPAAQPEAKLGTGHGQRENAWVSYTDFQRAQSAPNEVITIYYDSRENLLAQGVIPVPRALPVPHSAPQPFPAQPQVGFVPDPPRF